ncbi:MAG TPA: hypothetical protein VJH37_02690 [Candidatus Nanoarchaeia archaeon]|nr:hypothetical protein [Candidatus Nanoarchaeia archaeon]
MAQSYKASYTVNGGVTGLGCICIDTSDQRRTFQAVDDHHALFLAGWYAHFLSMNHLNGPDGKTVVSLDVLQRPDGSPLDQQAVKPTLEGIIGKLLHLSPQGTVVAQSNFHDHLLYKLMEPYYKELGFLAVA